MSNATPSTQDLSNWNGQPFWTGWPTDGRVAYLVYSDDRFEALGKLETTGQVAFAVRGLVEVHLNPFKAQMWQEGARVVEPKGPLNTDTVEPTTGNPGHGDGVSYNARD